MRHFLSRLIAGVTHALSIAWGYTWWVALAIFLPSCGTAPPARDHDRLAADPPRYSLVFIIHGDGDYLYHDALGNARQADEDVLAKAQAIAEQSPNAEVFIFHEIERRHLLFLIPRRDGRAYYYRNGRLLARESYWRDQGESRFDPEVRLHAEFAGSGPRPPIRMFFYFGHELPEFDDTGYDDSYSKRPVSILDLAAGVGNIAGESKVFDILTLATCFGGTPYTIGALAPHARYIIASPDNLHLSFFDLEPLAGLDVGSSDSAVAEFADRFARNAFEQLAREVQTVVSVVVYDVNDVSAFVDSVADTYDRTLMAANAAPPALLERCDCADEASYAMPEMNKGLTIHYRASRFGRMKNEERRSGWECWRTAK